MPPLPHRCENDAALIAESLHRPESFAALYDRHAPAIHRFAARRLGDHAADDVVADTFLAAFRIRDRYDVGRPDAGPWLYGIATRLIGRQRRSEVRMWRAVARSRVDLYADADAARIDDRVAAAGTQRALAAALACLSADDRHVLLLVAWAELTYEEVATALEIPIGTVRSRLNRARRKVRAELDRLQPTTSTEELCHERA
jgi:RNA polymerase sigma-70 factor (ECF subfamily)